MIENKKSVPFQSGFILLIIMLGWMAFQIFGQSHTPKLKGWSNGTFSPQIRCKALYSLKDKVLARTEEYLQIDPKTLSCKSFERVSDSIQALAVSPNGEHLFALALDVDTPYFVYIKDGKQKRIQLSEFASRRTNFLYSVLVCNDERVVLINPRRMYTWKISELEQNKSFEFMNDHAAGCEYSCFAIKGSKLFIGEDREHYGGRLVRIDLDNGKFENLLDKSVCDLLFDKDGKLWTINKLPNGDPGKICVLEGDQLKVISSITRPNPDKNEAKIAYNWDFPITQFQKLFLNDKGVLIVATDTEGFFAWHPESKCWKRKGPDKIFGLDAFEKILPLAGDQVIVAGHINNDCTFMIYDFGKNSYRLIKGDENQVKDR